MNSIQLHRVFTVYVFSPHRFNATQRNAVTSLQVLLIVVNRVACLGPNGRGWLVFKVLPGVLIVVNWVACLDPTGRGWLVFKVLPGVLIVVNWVACMDPTGRGRLVFKVLLIILIVVGPNRRGWLQCAVPFCGGVDI